MQTVGVKYGRLNDWEMFINKRSSNWDRPVGYHSHITVMLTVGRGIRRRLAAWILKIQRKILIAHVANGRLETMDAATGMSSRGC